MTDPTPIFSVSQFTTWGQSFEQDLALYSRLGIPGIEVCERKLDGNFDEALDQLKRVTDAGLAVTSVQPRVHAVFPDFMCPDVADPYARAAKFCETIRLFSCAFPGQMIPLVAIGGAAPGGQYRLAHETARRIYPALADFAADHGLRIMFEPLTPLVMNTDTFICTLGEAIDLIDDVDRPNFGLMLDVWHVWREPDLRPRLKQSASRVFGVHISDWPHGEPRLVADRVLPGDGQIDLAGMLGALHAGGYRGAYCLEIFSDTSLADSLWRADPAEIVMRGRQAFERIWRERRCD